MNWEEIIMNAMWGFVGSVLGVIGALGFSIWSDKKGYHKIERLIGKLDNITLSGQHNDMSKQIDTSFNGVNQNSNNIYHKVEDIKTILDKSEVRYENLNYDQKEIRNYVLNLVTSYEKLVDENKRLSRDNTNLQSQLQVFMAQKSNHRSSQDKFYYRDEDEEELEV